MKRSRCAPLVIAVMCACGPPDESETGGLGNGSFNYDCVSQDDSFCPSFTVGESSTTTSFPSAIALNAPFSVGYYVPPNLNNGNYGTPTVVPVSQDFVASASSGFIGLRPGTPWFWAQLPNGQAFDIGSVHFVQIGGIGLTNGSGLSATAFSETVGQTDTFTAQALAADGSPLAGAVTYTWSDSDPKIMSFTNVLSGTTKKITVLFTSTGTVTLTATVPGAQNQWVITVGGQ